MPKRPIFENRVKSALAVFTGRRAALKPILPLSVWPERIARDRIARLLSLQIEVCFSHNGSLEQIPSFASVRNKLQIDEHGRSLSMVGFSSNPTIGHDQKGSSHWKSQYNSRL